jgi:hypothetical protein
MFHRAMGKIIWRIGLFGFAIACVLFAVSRITGPVSMLGLLETVFWPASILPSQRFTPARLSLGELFAVSFSALMNDAFYSGSAWLVWWLARLGGIAKTTPSARARFISLLLAVCLIFTALAALAEAAIHRPQFSPQGFLEAYLISANLFALIVLTCAISGWAFWWLRDLVAGRSARVDRT